MHILAAATVVTPGEARGLGIAIAIGAVLYFLSGRKK